MPMSPAIKLTPVQINDSPSSSYHGSRLKGRRRSSSLVKVESVVENQEQVLDQSVYVNVNVEWVNRKGALFSSFIHLSERLNEH